MVHRAPVDEFFNGDAPERWCDSFAGCMGEGCWRGVGCGWAATHYGTDQFDCCARPFDRSLRFYSRRTHTGIDFAAGVLLPSA